MKKDKRKILDGYDDIPHQFIRWYSEYIDNPESWTKEIEIFKEGSGAEGYKEAWNKFRKNATLQDGTLKIVYFKGDVYLQKI